MLKVVILIVTGIALYTFAGVTVGSIAADAVTELFAPVNAALSQVIK